MNLTSLYDYSELSNATGLLDMFSWVDTASGNLFIPLILLGVFLITWIGLQGYMSEKAFIAAGFSTSLVALMFWAAGIVHVGIVFTLFLLTSIMLLVSRSRLG